MMTHMTAPSKYILLVDDQPEILDALELYLSTEGYKTLKASNGKQALELLAQYPSQIQIILSDVEMPEMSGHDLCKEVRADERFETLPFIFVSAHTDLDEKIAGYSVGADEYIGKPITDPNELIFKTRNLIDTKLKHETLNQQLSESFSAGMQAMTYSSHLGQILLFLQDASHMKSYAEVANRLFETTESFGANTVIQFNTPNGLLSFRKNGVVSPLEENIMELTKKKSRFFDFEARTIINYDRFSLLIKNMPIKNPEAYGTMKDVLGNLCNAIDTITEILWAKELNVKKESAMINVEATLDKIENTLTSIQNENTNVIEDMMAEIDEAMLLLGLTDRQEENIRHITQNCFSRSQEVLKKADVLKNFFINAHETLNI